jgi:uncharacterized repeat protein (TIGR01451 family)
VNFVSCTETGGKGSCGFSGGTVTASFADLALDESQTVTITGTINSTAQNNVTVLNSATVTALLPDDPNSANNTSKAGFTVHNLADLAVAKSVSSTSPYWPATGIEVGDPLTYTVTLTNKGPYDAESVVLSDSAPAGVTFTGCTASVGTCVWSASSASLSLSSLTNASVATLTISAKLNFGVADGSTITNTASVTSTTNDPDPTNNSASTSFTALNKSDLLLTQTVAKLVNQQLSFTISVKNLGPYQAKQLLLNDAMPNGTKFVSVAAGPWTCVPLPVNSTGTLSCTVPTLNLNASDSLSFLVKVTTTGKNISNTATVGAATFDPNLATTLRPWLRNPEQGNEERGTSLERYFEALRIYCREYGASHPEIAVVLNNLGALYHATGRPKLAESILSRVALRMKRRELGASHPDIGVTMNNLAMLLRGQGRCELAESWFKRALQILKSSLGSSHPVTRELRNNQPRQHHWPPFASQRRASS